MCRMSRRSTKPDLRGAMQQQNLSRTISEEKEVNNNRSKKFWGGSGVPVSVLALAFVLGCQLAQGNDTPTPQTQPVNYTNVIQIGPRQGVIGDLAPIVRIVSPLADSRVAPGEGKIGAGSPNGTGFAVNLEIVTRDKTPVSLREATNIRRADLLDVGALNPNAPGLYFFFDVDLITPDGRVLPKFNNFASAFNIAGTDDTPGDGVTAWLGWHVLESVPEDVNEFTMTAAFVDDAGRIGMDRITLKVDRSKSSGQALTPEPFAVIGAEGIPGAPQVTMIAPRVPTSV